MEKAKKLCLQILKVTSVAILLIIIPLLSTSLKFKYLYIIVNILIIAVCAEAGLLSFLHTNPNSDHDYVHHVSRKAVMIISGTIIAPLKEKVIASGAIIAPLKEKIIASGAIIAPLKEKIIASGAIIAPLKEKIIASGAIISLPNPVKAIVEKCAPEKIIVAVKVLQKVIIKKSPSIFFIEEKFGDDVEDDSDIDSDSDSDNDNDQGGGEELFQKSESFIEKFYEQLKLQRQKSWNKNQPIAQKDF